MPYRVAIIGSSGGGTATLGHTDASNLLKTINDHLSTAGIQLCYSCYVALENGKGMDAANEQIDSATLYSNGKIDAVTEVEEFLCKQQAHGTLRTVNTFIRENSIDAKLADAIQEGTVTGLICISCSPKLFPKTLSAASAQSIAVTGSGGTSLSQAASLYGLQLVGNAGGSVSTSTVTRAISYTYALANHWKLKYRPWGETTHEPSFVSVLNSCLPTFWGVCLFKYVLKQCLHRMGIIQAFIESDYLEELKVLILATITSLESWVIPTTCAVTMASSSNSKLLAEIPQSSLAMAAVISASTCSHSMLSGFLAGWLVKRWAKKVFFRCIVWNIPATMSGLISSTGTGAIVATSLLPLKPILSSFTALTRMAIRWSLSFQSPIIRGLGGMIWGIFCCYGSKVGWYHSVILPMILVEMELGEPSFLGSVDELTLVLVCTGICGGYLCSVSSSDEELNDSRRANISLCRRALRTNICFGDFVEACYPFMESSRIVNVAGYVASGLTVAILVINCCDSVDSTPATTMAYLPYPISLLLTGPNMLPFACASIVAVGVSFLPSFLYFTLQKKKHA